MFSVNFMPPDFPNQTVLADTSVKDIWLPTYPKLEGVQTIYVFYEPINANRVLYVGKTDKLRQRARWHLMGNTFITTQWETLWLRVFTVDADWLECERILIRHWLPPFNVNIKKTFKRTIENP